MDELTHIESQVCVKCFAKLLYAHLSHATFMKSLRHMYFSNQVSEKLNNMSKGKMVYNLKFYFNA